MRKILLLVEGQTEEKFVKTVLNPHLLSFGKYLVPVIIRTKKVKRGNEFKGGVTSYVVVRRQILRLLNDTSAVLIGTMIDYYGLPDNFPGRQLIAGATPIKRVQYLEDQLRMDIDNPRFLPYYSLHEFEALLFSDPVEIANTLTNPQKVNSLQSIRSQFPTPEDINDDIQTHPSARIQSLFRNYQKHLHGSLISQRIGINQIRSECMHFSEWLSELERV